MSSSSIALRPSGPPGGEPWTGSPALGVAGERVAVRPEVVELGDEHGAVRVHGIDDAAQRGDETVVVVAVVLRCHAGIREDRQRLHHDQPGTARGACRVVVASPLARDVILAERHGVGGEDDAARQAHAAHHERREQQEENPCSRSHTPRPRTAGRSYATAKSLHHSRRR